jgi:hypothetical protein
MEYLKINWNESGFSKISYLKIAFMLPQVSLTLEITWFTIIVLE